MKKSSYYILIIIIMIFFSCNKNSDVFSIEKYRIDLYNNEEPESLVIHKEIYVGNKKIGDKNKDNLQKALKLVHKNKNLSFYYKYNIDIIENNVAKTLFFTNIPSDYLIDVKLEQGYKFTDSINRNTINEKFLRIKFYFNNGSIDSYYLNFKINNKYEYYLISKEKFSTDTNQNNNVGYCVEVYNKKINEEHMAYKNEINFMSSFFYSKNNWKCNEQINKKQK